MSYAFPRALSYPYPADGPVRVGRGIAPSGLGGGGDPTVASVAFEGLALVWLVVMGVTTLGILASPFYMGYKLVTSAKDD